MVCCNEIDQPIGKEAKHLGDFLGSVARNGSLCCFSYKDQRFLKTEINLKAIIDQVKVNFNPLNILLLACSMLPYIAFTLLILHL